MEQTVIEERSSAPSGDEPSPTRVAWQSRPESDLPQRDAGGRDACGRDRPGRQSLREGAGPSIRGRGVERGRERGTGSR